MSAVVVVVVVVLLVWFGSICVWTVGKGQRWEAEQGNGRTYSDSQPALSMDMEIDKGET